MPEDLTQALITEPYARDADGALVDLGVSAEGLSTEEAAERLKTYGHNAPPFVSKTPALLRFLAHFNNVQIKEQIGAAAVHNLLGHPEDTAVNLAVV